ncbi:MAG: hypothetical protein AB1899_02570 [Pseudomonadota bacterium]
MNTPQPFPPVDSLREASLPGGELAHLLAGLQRQKEELGPIADELISLLRRLGVEDPPRDADRFSPSNG